MKIVVTGLGLVSALGIGIEENIALIREEKTGIKTLPKILKTSNKLPVGELCVSNEDLHSVANINSKSIFLAQPY